MSAEPAVKEIDFEAAYEVKGYEGVAFRLTGWAQKWVPCLTWEFYDDAPEDAEAGDPEFGEDVPTEEGEWEDNHDFVIAVMVGDDRKHEVDPDDLTVISEEEYCGGCGQIGCTAEKG